jgi:putative PIN family toxin of toxin-antitoxin system
MSAGRLPLRLRVVLDTNVYFSAFTHPQGVPFQLWQQAVRRQYLVFASPAIVRELAGVLRDDLNWPDAGILAHLKLLARVAQIIRPKQFLKVISHDPDDDRILECAVEGKAGLIVSGDRHLIRLKSFQGIGIVRPIDFKRLLGS